MVVSIHSNNNNNSYYQRKTFLLASSVGERRRGGAGWLMRVGGWEPVEEKEHPLGVWEYGVQAWLYHDSIL